MAKGCALSTDYLPRGGLPRNSVDRITDRPDMTSAVDSGRKATTQTKNQKIIRRYHVSIRIQHFLSSNTATYPRGRTCSYLIIVLKDSLFRVDRIRKIDQVLIPLLCW